MLKRVMWYKKGRWEKNEKKCAGMCELGPFGQFSAGVLRKMMRPPAKLISIKMPCPPMSVLSFSVSLSVCHSRRGSNYYYCSVQWMAVFAAVIVVIICHANYHITIMVFIQSALCVLIVSQTKTKKRKEKT